MSELKGCAYMVKAHRGHSGRLDKFPLTFCSMFKDDPDCAPIFEGLEIWHTLVLCEESLKAVVW